MFLTSLIKLQIMQDSKTAVLCFILPDVYKKAQSVGKFVAVLLTFALSSFPYVCTIFVSKQTVVDILEP